MQNKFKLPKSYRLLWLNFYVIWKYSENIYIYFFTCWNITKHQVCCSIQTCLLPDISGQILVKTNTCFLSRHKTYAPSLNGEDDLEVIATEPWHDMHDQVVGLDKHLSCWPNVSGQHENTKSNQRIPNIFSHKCGGRYLSGEETWPDIKAIVFFFLQFLWWKFAKQPGFEVKRFSTEADWWQAFTLSAQLLTELLYEYVQSPSGIRPVIWLVTKSIYFIFISLSLQHIGSIA